MFRVLGSVAVVADDTELDIGGPRQRRLLAALLVHAREAVSRDRLIDAVWADGAPQEAARTLRTYVARLRKSLAATTGDDVVIATAPGGYRLDVPVGSIDAEGFEQAVSEAGRQIGADPEAALRTIDDALSLWHGEAYSEFAHEPWCRPEAVRLDELRVAANEMRIEALLTAGRHREAVADLETLVVQFPLREGFRAQHMLALHRSGRQAEALRAYEGYRRTIGEELGLEPSDALRSLEGQIAVRDPALQAPVPATRSLRGYRLGTQLGEGAHGTVYRGIQPSLEREVALKVIKAQLANDPRFIRQFEMEAHIVARLEHPHVVPLYDFWREPDAAYMVMRYLRGGSVRNLLAGGPIDLDHTGRILVQVGKALEAAHRAGLIHRDVQPSNILLDEEGNAYLSDFGVASGVMENTPRSPVYASPAQLRGDEPAPADDVYALGAMGYEMLTARRPFHTSTPADVVLATLERDGFPTLLRSRPDLPKRFTTVIDRATGALPEQRYESVSAFLVDLVEALGGPTESLAATGITAENPYKGLRPFSELDAGDFFGRDALIDEMQEHLKTGTRLLAVVGPSGSGKSSAVRAGLLPRLRAGGVPGSSSWFVTTLQPGGHPFEELEAALLRVAINPPPSLLAQLRRDERGIARAVRRVLPHEDSTELVLVIDQFEELFTQAEPSTTKLFTEALIEAVLDARSRLRVILTIRADFYDRPLRHHRFGELLKSSTVTATAMSSADLRAAIVEPARNAGVAIDSQVVADIVTHVADRPSALPLLQYALTELFDARTSGRISSETYRRLDGVAGAMARRADEICHSLGPVGERLARQLFGRLVTIGEGSEDTRRRVPRRELVGLAEGMDDVIESFGSARLLSFGRDPDTREPTVELAHEALLREWPRLRDWMDEDRANLRAHRRLAEAVRQWDEAGRVDDFLLSGGPLLRFEGWLDEPPLSLTTDERNLVQRSVAQRDADRLRVRRRRRAIFTALSVAAVVSLVFAFSSLTARRDAETQRIIEAAVARADQEPQVSLLLAAEAYQRDPGPTTLGALQRSMIRMGPLLGYYGGDRDYIDVVWLSEVQFAAARRGGVDIYDVTTGERFEVNLNLWVGSNADAGFTDVVVAMAGSDASGLFAVAARVGNEVAVFDREGTEVQRIQTLEKPFAVAFDSTGSRLAIGAGGAVGVWDPVGGESLWYEGGAHPEFQWSQIDLPEGTGFCCAIEAFSIGNVNQLAFSPHDDTLASARGPIIRVWDGSTGELQSEVLHAYVTPFIDLPAVAESLTFDPTNPGVILAASGTAMARYDIRTGTRLGTSYVPNGRSDLLVTARDVELVDSTTAILALRDGRVLLSDPTGMADGEVTPRVAEAQYIWGAVEADAVLSELETGASILGGAAIAPSRARFAVATDIGVFVASLDQSQLLAESVARVPSDLLSVNGPGTMMMTSSNSPGGNTLWDIAGDQPHAMEFPAIAETWQTGFDPDPSGQGTIFAFSPQPGPIVLFDAQTLEESPLPALPVTLAIPAYSADGGLFAIDSPDLGSVRVLNKVDGSLNTQLRLEGSPLEMLDFSHDGRMLVGAGFARGTNVWDLETGEVVLRIGGPDESGLAGFSRTGRYLVTVSANGELSLRDPSTGDPITTLVGPTRANERFATGPHFSPDDGLILSLFDGQPRLWDTTTGVQIGEPFPNDIGVRAGGAEGEVLRLVTKVDGTAVVWNLDTSTWFDIACRAAGRNLTKDEWDRFGPTDTDYRATCPQYPVEE